MWNTRNLFLSPPPSAELQSQTRAMFRREAKNALVKTWKFALWLSSHLHAHIPSIGNLAEFRANNSVGTSARHPSYPQSCLPRLRGREKSKNGARRFGRNPPRVNSLVLRVPFTTKGNQLVTFLLDLARLLSRLKTSVLAWHECRETTTRLLCAFCYSPDDSDNRMHQVKLLVAFPQLLLGYFFYPPVRGLKPP